MEMEMVCNIERVLKAIVISKGEADLDIFPENTIDNYQDENGNIILYVDPDKYSPITVNQGSSFVPTGGEAFLNIGLTRKGFRVDLDYSQAYVRQAVHIIAQTALRERYLVEIDDYVGPEQGDIEYEVIVTNQEAIDNYNGPGDPPEEQTRLRVTEGSFTRREGIIQVPIDYKGAIGDSQKDGFGFTFVEKNLRYI